MKTTRILFVSVCALLVSFTAAYGQKNKKNPEPSKQVVADSSQAASTDKGKKALAEKLKHCVADSGLFVLYRDSTSGTLWVRLHKSQLEKEYIHFVYSENGVTRAGHFRGNYQGSSIVRFRRYFNRIELVKENVNHYFDPNSPLSKAADANISPAILVSLKIAAEDSAAGHILISGDDIFLSEGLHQVKPSFVPNPLAAFMFQLGSLNREKSRIHQLRNYPENTDLVIDYTYDNPYPINRGGSDVADARAVTLRLQHSLIAVPDNAFQPRFEDPRVGYFTQSVTDMTTTRSANWRDPINRWHLEKKDPTQAVSEPVQPIVWWLENTTPLEFRDAIRDGILAWNEAFEAAGFRNAVQVKIQPDDADWDAGDIRYNVIRWTSSPYPLFGGYGPSFVNPRTGQILGADVMLEWAFVTNRVHLEKLLAPQGMLDFPTDWDSPADEHTCAHGHCASSCHFGLHMQNSLQFGKAFLETQGNYTPIQVTELMKQGLYYLAMHEVGHTLGLSHNMRASQLHTPAQLRNRDRVVSQGLIASVMDYPAIHIDPDTAQQTLYYTTKPGPYDIWAIQYGYTPALNNTTEEEARMQALLSRSTHPELAFGNDADDMRSPGKAIDPRVMIGDLSADAIAYAQGRIELAKALLPRLTEKYKNPEESYHELKVNFGRTLGEIGTQAGVVSRYVGGVYVDRAFQEQPGATQPYTPVPAATQRKAMQLLATSFFAPNAFTFPDQLLNFLQPQRRGFEFFSSTEDPKVTTMVLTLHRSVLVHLLHPNTQQRMVNTAEYGNTYSLSAFYNDLTQAIFAADIRGDVNVYRQNLQAVYIGYLLRIANPAQPQQSIHPHAAQAEAMRQLRTLQAQMRANQTMGNAASQAHRTLLLHTLNKAFEVKG